MLVFIDESWQKTADGKFRAGVLSAVAISSASYNEFSRNVYRLKCKHIGKDAGNIELKGKSIFGKFMFRLEAKGIPCNQLALAREIFDLYISNGGKIFGVVTFEEKELGLSCSDPNNLDRPFFFLFERIHQYVKENHASLIAKIVFDDRGAEGNRRISMSISNFFHRSQSGQSFDKILKVPFFAISNENVGIQLADNFAHIIGRRFTGDENVHDFFTRIKNAQFISNENNRMRGIKVAKPRTDSAKETGAES